jgi:ubiquinone/menaquinone biosynthesis C-methylase UbiE
MEFPAEILKYNQWREKLFKEIEGSRVLEVGIGTGKNLKHYTDNYRGIGIDLSEGMLSKAKARADKKGISLIQMDAQSLAFKDNTFDTVLATFLFCSVPNPVLGLQEIKRVLKPGGRALFIEHVLPKNPFLYWLFNILNPFTVKISGVHINRKTTENIRMAGFELSKEESLLASIFKYFIARPVYKTHDSLKNSPEIKKGKDEPSFFN